jgi:glycosyltransferase involved in cell wall biosynthesis
MIQELSENCSANNAVLHLIDTTGPGGAETVFIQLAEAMGKRGYRSVVVIRGPGWVQQELQRRGIDPIVLESKGSFNVKFLWALVSLVKKENIALIHSHLLGSNVYAAITGLIARVPVVATYHGMVDVSPNERFRRTKHQLMRWGISHYVAVSNGLMSNIREQGLLSPEKTTIVYNGIDTSKYARNKDQSIRESLNLPAGAILVGSLGNVRKAKAYDVLVSAAAQVVARSPEVHFIIAGDKKPSIMKALNEQIEKLNIAANIHFLGFQQDCAAMLAQMDIFLLSSTSEGFSISTIEAMATGLPVLVTRCGGPEEIVEHNRTGWMVEVNNAEAIAEGFRVLLKDAKLCERLAQAGKQHAVGKFGLQNMLSSYDKIYQELGVVPAKSAI